MTDRTATRQQLQMEQEARWNKIVTKWEEAGRNGNCIVIGDINLDMLRWSQPEQHLVNMVDITQNVIEVAGFTQIVDKVTRCWKSQSDSYH